MAGKKGSRWKTRPYLSGAEHWRWTGGERSKVCELCGVTFSLARGGTVTNFRKRRFCSPVCGWKGQKYNRGPEHPRYREDARRRNRSGAHRQWQQAVLNRDGATCQRCGATGVEMHAHHLKSYKDFPDLRFDVTNGETLCYRCHWNEHTASTANAVKSGNTPPEQSEGNPEPSLRGDVREGVTTRGRVFRRWVGTCDECGLPITKPLSDATGKRWHFCTRKCLYVWNGKRRLGKPRPRRKDSNASTSAAPERDDIV